MAPSLLCLSDHARLARHPLRETKAHKLQPPHCPWAGCAQHQLGDGEPFAYRKVGTYERKSDRRVVQRFRCSACGRTFSQQTFCCTYYLKRPELLDRVFAQLNGCSAHRQIARTLECAPNTVTRLSQRVGRHAMLVHFSTLDRLDHIDEPIVLDHFETFAYSQWDRVALATPVGGRSRFLCGLEPAAHQRAGRVSAHQKEDRVAMPPGAMSVYRRERITPALGHNAQHALKNAF